jgi:hypothetical protein
VTIEFGETVTGFDAGKVDVTNGTKGALTEVTTGKKWTLPVMPVAPGLVTVNIAAGKVTDDAGNPNVAAAQLGITYDTIAPANQDTVLAASVAKNSGMAVPIVSSGDASNSVWLAPAATTVFVEGGTMTRAGGTATSIVAPAVEGTYKLFVIDSAGNVSAASTAGVTVDNTPPTVAITSTRESPTTNLSSIPVKIMFSENVTGFSFTGVTVSNGALGNFVAVSGREYTFDLTITGNSHPKVDVAADLAQDESGNKNTAAPQYAHQVSGADGSDVTVDGSVYVLVPRYALPDSTVVPAFYCGKYPATAGAANAAGATYSVDSTVRQAATTATGAPWVFITWTNAKLACTAAGDKLIGENQWLSIAHQTMGITANWRNGIIGSTEASGGGFYRGLSGNTLAQAQPAVGGDAGFDPPSTSVEYRIKKLPNNSQIWDIGGNVSQWVDQLQFANTWYTGVAGAGFIETNLVGITTTNIKTLYDSTYGVGTILNSLSVGTDRGLCRGNSWTYLANAGAFALIPHPTSGNNVGFRCTRP